MQGYDLLDTDGGAGGGGDGEEEDSDEEDIFGRTKCRMPGILACLELLALEDPQVAARRCTREGQEGQTLAQQMFVWHVRMPLPSDRSQAFQDGDYDKAIRYWQGSELRADRSHRPCQSLVPELLVELGEAD